MKTYRNEAVKGYRFIFFTGKGGVGKTSSAAATAVTLADEGKKVLLLSTDPASNLQDIFGQGISFEKKEIPEVPGLTVVNLDPLKSAERYKEAVVGPYRGKMPESLIRNMEEQLSGSCTVEVAAFNEFAGFLADEESLSMYDHVVFDTAPTGHTLRMLELPAAWTSFLDSNKSGASCLGQLSGLSENRKTYEKALKHLGDGEMTRIVLVSRAQKSPLLEADRASHELSELGITNTILLINGMVMGRRGDDAMLLEMARKEREALDAMPEKLRGVETYSLPLRPYAIDSIGNIRAMLVSEEGTRDGETLDAVSLKPLKDLADRIRESGVKVLFTMGKGGVGKTTIASALAHYLADSGMRVHLTSTDPASHLDEDPSGRENLVISTIDEDAELAAYREEVLSRAGDISKEDRDYIEEDLRSPCTQEIALFRKFAKIVKGSDEDIVIIDTAPTGHTLLLLDSTESYHKEVQRSSGIIPDEVRELLPRLRNPLETQVIIVTLPEPTPFFEAERLAEDLGRAGIKVSSWVLNQSMLLNQPEDPFLKAKGESEKKWINEVSRLTGGDFHIVPWMKEDLKDEGLLRLFQEDRI